MTLSQKVRKLRQTAGMTQWQLSQIVGCTPGTILLIERGQRECDVELMRALAKALNVSENYLKG